MWYYAGRLNIWEHKGMVMPQTGHIVRNAASQPLGTQDFFFLKRPDLDTLALQVANEPEAAGTITKLLYEYLERLQSPPGSGRYSELTIAEEIVAVSAQMNGIGLWGKVNRDAFIASLHPKTPREVKDLLRSYAPATS